MLKFRILCHRYIDCTLMGGDSRAIEVCGLRQTKMSRLMKILLRGMKFYKLFSALRLFKGPDIWPRRSFIAQFKKVSFAAVGGLRKHGPAAVAVDSGIDNLKHFRSYWTSAAMVNKSCGFYFYDLGFQPLTNLYGLQIIEYPTTACFSSPYNLSVFVWRFGTNLNTWPYVLL